jgi:Sulfotransferase family
MMAVPAPRKGNSNKRTLTSAAIIVFLAVAGIASLNRRASTIFENEAASTLLLHQLTAAKNASQKVKPIKAKTRPLVLLKDFKGLQVLSQHDSIYKFGAWDEGPVIIESHKLLFFTIPKVGCTVFKQLFRRMYGYDNWKVHNNAKGLPHQPGANGLNYLYHYTPRQADFMLTDPAWTRAIFVREPKERLLSAYLDKVVKDNGKYVQVHCCHVPQLETLLHCDDTLGAARDRRGNRAAIQPKAKVTTTTTTTTQPLVISFSEFLQTIYPQCMDPHWRPQADRMPQKYWKYINFVGHIDTIKSDTRRLLESLGDAWETFGATGWEQQEQQGASSSSIVRMGGDNDNYDDDNNNNERKMIFAGTVEHATAARERLREFYTTPELELLAEELHAVDYEKPLFNISKTRIHSMST